MFSEKRKSRLLRKSCALFVSACLILCDSFGYASTNSLQTPDLRQQTQAGFLIPAEFGTVEESAAGNSGKTVFYLQDAHDSLEAQENIAKMIDHLVSAAGVKTVFEEGYTGPVPTDEYFGQIENPDTKEKASYFLMDRLRLGGAEYSHINRQLDWKLIGADDLELHLENIEAYRKTASRKASVLPELNAIREDLQTLINRDFPPDVREWLKTHRLFTAGKMELTDYLGRALPLWKAGVALDGKDFAASYPQLALLEAAAQPGTQDGAAAAKRLGEIDPKRLFSEMENAEEAFAAAQLKDEKTKTLFHCVRMIGLLERLFDFKLTSSEYAAVREEIRSFDTRRVAGLLSGYTGSPVFLTRRREILAREAVRFYEIARKRDEKIGQQLDAFVRDPEEKTAVIVFGGFHKDGLKTLLRERGLAYEIITPKISGPSERHQQYYKQLMAAGRLPFETKRGGEDAARLSVPQTVAKAASNERMWTVPEDAALLPAIVQSIEAHPGLDRASLDRKSVV